MTATTRRLDAATVHRIHQSTEPNTVVARQLRSEGIKASAEFIRQIRAGMIYRDLLPKNSAATDGRTCRSCIHWRGIDAAEPCDLGHRDPLEEGIGFARWCNTFR